MFDCRGCGKHFLQLRNHLRHQETSIDCRVGAPVPCPHCTDYFISQFYLKAHQRSKHPMAFLKQVPNATRDVLCNRKHYLSTGPQKGQVFPEQLPHLQQHQEQIQHWNAPQQQHLQLQQRIVKQSQFDEKVKLRICIVQPSRTLPFRDHSPSATEIINLVSQESAKDNENVVSTGKNTAVCDIRELLVLDHKDIFKTFQLRNTNKEIVDVPNFLECVTEIAQRCLLNCLCTNARFKFNVELHLKLVNLSAKDMHMKQQSYATEFVKFCRDDDCLLHWQVQMELLNLKICTELDAADNSAIYEIKYLDLNIGSGEELPKIRVATNLF